MESLSGDVLSLVLERVSDGRDRKACSEVSTQWFTIEALTRTRVRVLDSDHLPLFLPRFPNLTTLEAHGPMSDKALMFVGESCPNLRTLDLQSRYPNFDADFGNDGLAAVARGCRSLVKVLLPSRKVGDNRVIALQAYTKDLAVLDLSLCYWIDDTSLVAIGNMESITELHLRVCSRITDNGLRLLSSGPASRSLRVLTVCKCYEITDVGVLSLKRMSRLEELNLQGDFGLTDVGGIGISAISSLKKLDLSAHEFITDETLFAVAKDCRNLVEINLDRCNAITVRGMVRLASCLPLERMHMPSSAAWSGLCSHHVVQIAEQCPSLKHMIVDKILKDGLSRQRLKKLRSLCRVEWV